MAKSVPSVIIDFGIIGFLALQHMAPCCAADFSIGRALPEKTRDVGQNKVE